MAIEAILRNPTGSLESMVQPVFVHDPTLADITEAQAVTLAQNDSPSSFFGVLQDGNPGVERVTPFAVRVFVNYRVRTLSNLTKQNIGQIRYNEDIHAERRQNVRYAQEVGAFPSGVDGAPSLNGLLTLSRGGNSIQPLGVTIEPPPPNMGAEGVFAIADVTAAWINSVSLLVGHVNSVAIGSHAAGEIMLVRVVVRQRDEDSVFIDIGWNHKENVVNETRGAITGITYDGHDYVWEWNKPEVNDQRFLVMVPQFVYVNRVWPRADISAVGINPPS